MLGHYPLSAPRDVRRPPPGAAIALLMLGALVSASCASADARPGLDRQECDIALSVLGPIISDHIARGGRVLIAPHMRLAAQPGEDERAYWDRVRAMGFVPPDRSRQMGRLLQQAYSDEQNRLRAQAPQMSHAEREAASWSHAHRVHGDDRLIPSYALWAAFHGRNARPSPLRCRAELARAGDFTVRAPGADLPDGAIHIELSRVGFSPDAREALIHAVVTRHHHSGSGPVHRHATLWRLHGGWPFWRADAGRSLWFAEGVAER